MNRSVLNSTKNTFSYKGSSFEEYVDILFWRVCRYIVDWRVRSTFERIFFSIRLLKRAIENHERSWHFRSENFTEYRITLNAVPLYICTYVQPVRRLMTLMLGYASTAENSLGNNSINSSIWKTFLPRGHSRGGTTCLHGDIIRIPLSTISRYQLYTHDNYATLIWTTAGL